MKQYKILKFGSHVKIWDENGQDIKNPKGTQWTRKQAEKYVEKLKEGN